MQARTVAAGRGWSWFVGGWRIFFQAPLVWMLFGLLLVFIMFVSLLVPIIGRLAFVFISPLLAAGMLFAAHEAAANRPIRLAYFWQGFRQPAVRDRLIALAAIAVVGAATTSLLASLLMHEATMALLGQPGAVMPPMGLDFWLRLLIVLAPQLLAALALSYAIPLVQFHNATVMEATRASVVAGARNVLPLLVFSVLYFGAAMVATMPYGIGWLLLLPASVAMLYVSYRDLFESGRNEASPPA